MIKSILGFLGGIGSFVSYITGYFKDSGIRGRQKEYDELYAKYRDALATISAKEEECNSKIAAISIEYESEISSLEDMVESLRREPDRTPRRIEG